MRKGKIPTQHWVRAGVGNPTAGGRVAAGVCMGSNSSKHTPILTGTPRGVTALRQQVKSRGQGPTWGSVTPKNPAPLVLEGKKLRRICSSLWREGREGKRSGYQEGRGQQLTDCPRPGLRGGPLPRPRSPGKCRISVAGLHEDHLTSGGPTTSEHSLPLRFSNTI